MITVYVVALAAVLVFSLGFVGGSFYEYLRADELRFAGTRSTTPDDVEPVSPFTVEDRKRMERTLASLEAHRTVADRWLP